MRCDAPLWRAEQHGMRYHALPWHVNHGWHMHDWPRHRLHRCIVLLHHD
ncbi:MAG: hypothetical protein WBD93_12090 [Acidobacteriaceae bacterium]